jgi:hypothetical protein
MASLRRRSDYLHFVPIVGRFFTTVEADHVGAGKRSSTRTTRPSPDSNREAVVIVPAAEERVEYFRDHYFLPPRARLPYFLRGSGQVRGPLSS